ncbi:hypothetical protein [Georgenia sp. AZ-5]|uniref:hypothetical protein n=1 Tax=Georgenia sp. AZ-5 TaxID=3367526 RepID=UPI003754C658
MDSRSLSRSTDHIARGSLSGMRACAQGVQHGDPHVPEHAAARKVVLVLEQEGPAERQVHPAPLRHAPAAPVLLTGRADHGLECRGFAASRS